VVSNHPDHREEVERFGIPYHHVPVERERKEEAEGRILALLEEAGVELLVLARHMQILSPSFVARFPMRIINIHHSFLPAFAGANPCRQAYERGVKLIGATAHCVTEELDQGPIIEQDVARVSHRHSVEELRRLGRSWSAPCWPGRCAGTWRTGSWSTATRPWSSSNPALTVFP
jgi:formyltetrahydrofolate deformylase